MYLNKLKHLFLLLLRYFLLSSTDFFLKTPTQIYLHTPKISFKAAMNVCETYEFTPNQNMLLLALETIIAIAALVRLIILKERQFGEQLTFSGYLMLILYRMTIYIRFPYSFAMAWLVSAPFLHVKIISFTIQIVTVLNTTVTYFSLYVTYSNTLSFVGQVMKKDNWIKNLEKVFTVLMLINAILAISSTFTCNESSKKIMRIVAGVSYYALDTLILYLIFLFFKTISIIGMNFRIKAVSIYLVYTLVSFFFFDTLKITDNDNLYLDRLWRSSVNYLFLFLFCFGNPPRKSQENLNSTLLNGTESSIEEGKKI